MCGIQLLSFTNVYLFQISDVFYTLVDLYYYILLRTILHSNLVKFAFKKKKKKVLVLYIGYKQNIN